MPRRQASVRAGREVGYPTLPPFGTHRALLTQWARDVIFYRVYGQSKE